MPNRKKITQDLYDRLMEAFKNKPGNYRHAAQVSGCDQRTAKKAWLAGWTQATTPWAVPIKTTLEGEQQRAREKLAYAQQEMTRTKAVVEDASTQLAEEAKLVRNVRQAASASLGVIALVFPAAQELGKQIVEDVKAGRLKGDPTAAMLVLQRFITSAARVASIAEMAQVMERRRLGQPSDVIAIAGLSNDDALTLADMERELKAAANALDRAKELGLAPGQNISSPPQEMQN
jgi:hypothetical protein